jgi:hypothetical protein
MNPQLLDAENNNRTAKRFIFSNLSTPESVVDLTTGQGLAESRANAGSKPCFVCRDSIWVTQECDIRDYVLEEGDAFLITLPGLGDGAGPDAGTNRIRREFAAGSFQRAVQSNGVQLIAVATVKATAVFRIEIESMTGKQSGL